MEDTTTVPEQTTIALRRVMVEARERLAEMRRSTSASEETSSPEKATRSEPPALPPWPAGVARAVPSEADGGVMSQMLQAAQAKRWPILLAGRSGIGKSCLACLVASQVPNWRFSPASELIGLVVQARTSDSKSVMMRTMAGAEVERNESEIFRWVESAPILVLDDVGVRLLTEVQSDILLRVLDLRFGKPTIVTTNCTAESLPQMVTERCASRLRAGAQFRMVGQDRRITSGGPR